MTVAAQPQTDAHRFNGWAKVLVGFIPLLVAGLVGWGTLRSDVSNLQTTTEKKADRDLVVQQYQAILREGDGREAGVMARPRAVRC